jgi:ribosome recycling factor
VGTGGYTLVHAKKARRKRREFLKEIKEAEESVRRGFAVLRRDIQAELVVIKKIRATKALSEEEKEKEDRLLQDLAWAEQYIGKELWDVYKTEEEN